MSLHLEPDRPDMPGVANLRPIERSDAQENPGGDPDVVRTFGVEATRDLDRPTSRRPARPATDIGAVPGIFACDDYPGDQSIDRIARIELRRIRLRLVVGHPPPRAIAFADLRPDIDAPHRRPSRLPVLRQSFRLHRARVAAGPALFEIVGVVRRARIRGKSALAGRAARGLVLVRDDRRPEVTVVDEAQQTAARRLPLPDIDDAAVAREMQATPGGSGRLAVDGGAADVEGAVACKQRVVVGDQNRELVVVILVLVADVVFALHDVPAILLLDERKMLQRPRRIAPDKREIRRLAVMHGADLDLRRPLP